MKNISKNTYFARQVIVFWFFGIASTKTVSSGQDKSVTKDEWKATILSTTESVGCADALAKDVHYSSSDSSKVGNQDIIESPTEANKYDLDAILSTAEFASHVDVHAKEVPDSSQCTTKVAQDSNSFEEGKLVHEYECKVCHLQYANANSLGNHRRNAGGNCLKYVCSEDHTHDYLVQKFATEKQVLNFISNLDGSWDKPKRHKSEKIKKLSCKCSNECQAKLKYQEVKRPTGPQEYVVQLCMKHKKGNVDTQQKPSGESTNRGDDNSVPKYGWKATISALKKGKKLLFNPAQSGPSALIDVVNTAQSARYVDIHPKAAHDSTLDSGLDIISSTAESVKHMDAHTEAVHVSKLDSHKAVNKYDLGVILSNEESVSCVDTHAKDVLDSSQDTTKVVNQDVIEPPAEANKYDLDVILPTAESVSCVDTPTKDIHDSSQDTTEVAN